MVIFIPVAFVGGTTGIFFKQFGLTMAVAVGISLLNALTLSPALRALLLRPNATEGKGVTHYLRKAYNATFTSLLKHYGTLVQRLLKRKGWVAGSVVAALLLFGILFRVVPTGFIPNEDMGTLFADLTPPSGYTANKTFDLMNRACDKIRELPEVQDVGGVVGVGAGANIFVQLKPWGERKGKDHSSTAVMEKISELMAEETEAQSFVSEPVSSKNSANALKSARSIRATMSTIRSTAWIWMWRGARRWALLPPPSSTRWALIWAATTSPISTSITRSIRSIYSSAPPTATVPSRWQASLCVPRAVR